jgi:hypothetical protein
MQRKKKWIIIGLAVVVVAPVMVFLALRYVPFHKLMRRPSSADVAFVNEPQSPGNAPFSLYYDFEVDTTQSTPSGLYKGIAHSGKYSTKAFGKNSFSLSLERQVSDLHVPVMDVVSLSAWVYVFPSDHEPQASLVFTVTNTVGVNTCWKGVSVHGPLVPRGHWFKISGTFHLSGVQIRPDDKIQVYFWNNSPTDILADDFYVVFGSQAPRKGDSARVDMTLGIPFRPTFNYPPFKTFFLERDEVGNGNSAWLVNSDGITQGAPGPADQLCTGTFGPGEGLASLLVLTPEGSMQLFHFCSAGNAFREIPVNCPPGLTPLLSGAILYTGSFLGTQADQLLFMGAGGLLLAELAGGGDPCKKEPASLTLKEIWSSSSLDINGSRVGNPNQLVVGDFNGDRLAELLVIGAQGSWDLFSFRNGGWLALALGEEDKLREWDSRFFDYRITPGRFVPKAAGDLLLTVFTDKNKNHPKYSLVKFEPAEHRFVPALARTEGTLGKTAGLDTLKLTDQFLTGNFSPGIPGVFLRYNRDWRYDLKNLRFNDSTFEILGNLDFRGYDKDFNPKYFEHLKLVSGTLVHPGITSLLVIAWNNENLAFLPNTLQVYTLPLKTKP